MATPDRASLAAATLLSGLTEIVARAATAICAIPAYAVSRRTKSDSSIVTGADEASENILLDGLAALAPDIPVISEELMTRSRPPRLGDCFFLVDPLDGTREYVEGRDEYAVNLALICEGLPLLGIIASPARRLLWRGIVGRGAERLAFDNEKFGQMEPVRTRRWPEEHAVAALSRSHSDPNSDALLGRLSIAHCMAIGSALKFCLIAEGNADVYPRLAPTKEWDVAAGDALIAAAGGVVTGIDGAPLSFGHAESDFSVPGFIAWGDPERARRGLL